jgi:hypothetical protein
MLKIADLPPKSRKGGEFFVIFRVGGYSKNIADSLNKVEWERIFLI